MLTRFAFVVALVLVACRDSSDPGFEIVKVPLSAYAATDASAKGEGGVAIARDGGDPVVLCIPKPEKKDDDESEDCPSEYQGRSYDEKATTRHRAKDDESEVCCYRKGRVPRRVDQEGE
jgi:hypothetical protein